MKNIFTTKILLLLFPLASIAQSETKVEQDSLTISFQRLSEIVISATKFPEYINFVAQHIKTLKGNDAVIFQNNTADALINSGSVFVQKSQQGGGSPVIRGFEASRVLLMVDGVRMNNAIYRAGHLQNIISIDNMVLDKTEILYGPSSTIYGSDALGGVVCMYTKKPLLAAGGFKLSGSTTALTSTATKNNKINATINIGGSKWASFTSFTYSDFGDVIQGKNRSSDYPDFGKKNFIVTRVGNTDSAAANSNINKQVSSAYKQYDITQKILFQPKENISHTLNLQFSKSSDIPRYDRLTETKNELPVFAEWYYGPQKRNMLAYHFTAGKQPGFFKDIKISASYQDVEESRISRRFKNNRKDSRHENVNIFGIAADAKHYSGKNELQLGIESYSNFIKSTAERKDIVSGAVSRIQTRYSDGPTSMSYHAVYAQHTLKINEHFTLNDGLRLNIVKLNAVFADTSIMKLPFKEARQNNVAVTGDAGIVYANKKGFRSAVVFSSGFRSPNVDDMSKVFESAPGTLIVPNPDVKPEYTYNAEINFTKYSGQFGFGGSVFYTIFNNALVLDDFSFNGKNMIVYDGTDSKVMALQNKAKATLHGFSLNAAYQFLKTVSIDGVVTYTSGTYNDKGNKQPLDHIPPVYGRIASRYEKGNWAMNLSCLFNGWKRIANYNLNGEDNQQYATADGMPSWIVFNFKLAYSIPGNLILQTAVENIFDRNYRYFASGISAPGRNFIFTISKSF